MVRALDLAREVAGRTSPNPAVGAVLVRDGTIVGEGATEPPPGRHAEIVALDAAREAARGTAGRAASGATMYVTLEPHPHHGRTPPCTDAIIAAGVAEVRYSHDDPNPSVSGKGRATLESAGISVTVGEGEAEAQRINEAYIKHRTTGLPFVIAKFAASLDGKIASTSGDSRWVSGPETRAWAHDLRTRIDAIAVGVNTVLVDNPQLTARIDNERLAERQPLRIIFDALGRTAHDARMLECGTGTLVATTHTSTSEWRDAIAGTGAEVAVLPDDAPGRVNLRAFLELLGRRDVLTLLIEGGGVLLGSFFDQRLVDKVHAIIAPMIIGGATAPVAVAGRGAERMADALRLSDVSLDRLGADLLVTGYVPHSD
jgi:diaminohydroxyphosphoribosylaminopyrimidine deaminase / 5-amino-6-(5-phosphoribosylamino)uracil reductase